jgi:hypothetical protein
MLQSSHDRAAELHNLAAHAHPGAATAHGKGDHLLLTSFQGKPKNTLGRLTRNRPTFQAVGTNQGRIKEISPSERLNLARICSRGRQQNTSPTSGNNSLAG